MAAGGVLPAVKLEFLLARLAGGFLCMACFGILIDRRKLDATEKAHTQKKGNWALKEDGKDRALRRFDTKADALKRGVLEGALGRGDDLTI